MIDKLTEFEWFNTLGDTVKFDEKEFRTLRKTEFPTDFFRGKEGRNIIGVKWKSDGKDIILDDVVGKSSLPTPNMDRVVVTRCIQKDDNFVYTTVIYNADGSPYLEVEMPKRTNFHCGNCIPNSPTFIADIGWTKDAQDNYSMIVELNGICDPCWEYMKFDPITGTFGESIWHGSF